MQMTETRALARQTLTISLRGSIKNKHCAPVSPRVTSVLTKPRFADSWLRLLCQGAVYDTNTLRFLYAENVKEKQVIHHTSVPT